MKLIYALGAPRTFYRFADKLSFFLAFFAFILLSIGFIWGVFYAPPDYQQGESVRIIYLHVPCAALSLNLYLIMAVAAFVVLVWRIKLASVVLHACAQVGVVFTLLALLTGSLWGKPTWGTWWVWDARLSSEFILLLLYAGIIGLGDALGKHQAAERMVAIMTWVGVIDLPIIHYSVKWWNTLHQGSSILAFAKPKIDKSMLYPLMLSMVGLGLFAAWAVLALSKYEILRREHRQAWVAELWRKQL